MLLQDPVPVTGSFGPFGPEEERRELGEQTLHRDEGEADLPGAESGFEGLGGDGVLHPERAA